MKQVNSGQIGFSDRGEVFQTVLGSCISLCIYDRKKQMGGMIHYLLPFRADHDQRREMHPLNFGTEAIPLLLKEFKEHGSDPHDLDAYIVGGAEFGEKVVIGDRTIDVGKENLRVARELMTRFRIRVKNEKVGIPKTGATVRFDSGSGEIFVSLKKRGDPASQAPFLESARPGVNGVASLGAAVAGDSIKVLIVDDSAPVRKILRSCIQDIPGLIIVGEAENPVQAETLRQRHNPDIMTLDVQMPLKDGITYLQEMRSASVAVNVILISDLGIAEVAPMMQGLDIGAFEYLQKPSGAELPNFRKKLQDTILAAKKFSDRAKAGAFKKTSAYGSRGASSPVTGSHSLSGGSGSGGGSGRGAVDLITIGSSTGGIAALRTIFAEFPANTPPILVVQHMPPVFSAAFSSGLNHLSKIHVKEAEDGDVLQPNTAYIAPGGQQMSLVKRGDRYIVRITDDPPVNLFKPSVDYLFESVAKLDLAKKNRSAILTGMGEDGARGMLSLKRAGSVTIAQNEETCVVYGMPKAAVELGAADKVVALQDIWRQLVA